MNVYLLLGTLAVVSLLYDRNENGIFFYLLMLFLVFVLICPVIVSKNMESTVDNIPSHKAKSVRKKLEIEQALDAILNKNTSSLD
ncbi:ac76 [Oxyplax ochracea nucleopolyhedrovirus]|uniref:Ac76 n=1 Tax=Oxyplax ochracea nucleopolyhedrovirus TaxID=2083176 RepID=A0A2L0WU31_9ABAC|nr:ac76 [Oxyplax ochracea nucleopolyhedrovirus]AVA31161.1 ac76 [Oxyplax ochracea nucleopolyhedrovirus]